MKPTGVIVAALDCRPDAIEAWNRWYDLDHLPPNVGLPGIMSGRRYVCTPPLLALRSGGADSWWADRHSTFLTVYTLCGDIHTTFGAMVELREQLDTDGRMFAEDQKAVRGGDGLSLTQATGREELSNKAEELPLLGHTGLLVLRRQDAGRFDADDHDLLADSLLKTAGATALLSYQSAITAATGLHLLLVSGDVASTTREVVRALDDADPARRFSQAAYAAIEPLTYTWADGLRASGLPVM